MAYKIVVSKEAHSDIDEIMGYIAGELHNAQAASDFMGDIEKSYRHPADNPLIYSLCCDDHLRRKGYHKVVLKKYLLLYRLDENNVYIVRVIYGARDYAKLL